MISLSQIIIDPYFRTIEGLIVLIEKEWLSFGHQFAFRNGILIKDANEDQRAPIFLQWLDCIHQLIYQMPNAFQFNLDLVLFIASHYNSNLYGTFMFNHEKERREKKAEKTASIWTDVYLNINKYLNPFYAENTYDVLEPNYAPYKLRLWEEYFLRWNFTINNVKILFTEDKTKICESNLRFFNNVKIQDKLLIEGANSKVNILLNILKDIYINTKGTEIYEKFSETSKYYLENLDINHDNNYLDEE